MKDEAGVRTNRDCTFVCAFVTYRKNAKEGKTYTCTFRKGCTGLHIQHYLFEKKNLGILSA